MIEFLAGSPFARAIGVALVQFAWQGAAIGAAAALALAVLRRATPQTRYVVACLGLVAMCAAPIVTVATTLGEAPPSITSIWTSRPSTPPELLRSRAANSLIASQEGPNSPAGP